MSSKDDDTSGSRLRRELTAKRAAKRTRRGELAQARERAQRRGRRNDLLPNLQLVRVAIADLKSASRRIHKRDEAQIARIGESLGAFGAARPILITTGYEIIDGHAAVEAAVQNGLTQLPAVIVPHLSDAEVKAFRIAVNRIPERAEWDLEELRVELQELVLEGQPIEGLGFDEPQLEIILDGDEGDAPEAADLEADTAGAAITRLLDLWLAPPHRILCADATRAQSYAALMRGIAVRLVLTDVPYNVRIAHNVSSRKRREFVQASGELKRFEFEAFNFDWMRAAIAYLVDGGLMASFIDWRSLDILLEMARELEVELFNLIVWAKTNAGMGAMWRSQHELLPVWKKGDADHVNNVELGRHGRSRSNVWTYPGASSLGSDSRKGLKLHPTVKPVAMLQDMLLDVTRRGDSVLDPFLGSGSTLIAAERSGRVVYGMDLDPAYVDVAVRRWQAETGREAILESTGETFAQVAARRARGDPEPEPAPALPNPAMLLQGPRHV